MGLGERRLRSVAPVIVAASLVGLLVILDYAPPGRDWYSDHPMTSAAISSAILFVAVSLLLQSWLSERESRRLDRISSVAYRSLAQYANDAGRALLAPLTGADLYALAIPDADRHAVQAARLRLQRHGHGPSAAQATGSWRRVSGPQLDRVLRDLSTESDFVRAMFRTTALMRRRLQDATALWAPVMLTSRTYASDLGGLRDLSDAMKLLQEHWRKSGVIGLEHVTWTPPDGWVDSVSVQYWRTIETYERIRDEFAEMAALPSDVIVRRRG